MNRLFRALAEERECYLLGLVRVAFGAMLLRHVARLCDEYLHGGYFGDHLHIPVLPWLPLPSAAVYAAWLALQVAAACCIVLGVQVRAALGFVSLSGLYLLACDRLQYHNNRYALLLLAFLLAFTPCDRSFLAVGRGRARPRIGPVWAQRLMQLQVSLIYLASSGGKLLDADWRGGQVMVLRGAQALEIAARAGFQVPHAAAALLTSPLVMSLASKLAIASEMFLALGLWHPRARPLALWIGVMFHLGIEISARVELFSYLMWTSYVLFVTPECRERTLLYRPDSGSGRRIASLVRTLDWFARFRIEAFERAPEGGSALCVIDRGGRASTGLRAFAEVTRALPLLFPLWLPLRALSALSLPRAPRAGAAAAGA